MYLSSKFLSVLVELFSPIFLNFDQNHTDPMIKLKQNNTESSIFISTPALNKKKKKKEIKSLESKLILTNAYTRLNCTRPNWLRQSKLPELDWRGWVRG